MNSSHNYVEETEISQQDTAVNLCDELQMKSSKNCNRKCMGCQSSVKTTGTSGVPYKNGEKRVGVVSKERRLLPSDRIRQAQNAAG